MNHSLTKNIYLSILKQIFKNDIILQAANTQSLFEKRKLYNQLVIETYSDLPIIAKRMLFDKVTMSKVV